MECYDSCRQNCVLFAQTSLSVPCTKRLSPIQRNTYHITSHHKRRKPIKAARIMGHDREETGNLSLSNAVICLAGCMVCVASEIRSQQLCVYSCAFLGSVTPHNRTRSFPKKSF